jgi:alpha-amylase
LNDKFGTAEDLKALTAEVHKRGMFIMVDVVANNVSGRMHNRYLMKLTRALQVMATSTEPDYSKYMFKDAVSA